MTFNGAIMQLVEMRENSMMPVAFKPYFDKVIETLSEVEPAPQWTLCSEQLPVGSEIVLLTIPEHTDKYGDYHYSGVVCGHYISGREEWGISDGSKFGYGLLSKCYEVKPIAWMPLPLPYYPESEE